MSFAININVGDLFRFEGRRGNNVTQGRRQHQTGGNGLFSKQRFVI